MASSLGPSLHSEPNTTTSHPLPQSRDADQHYAPAKQPLTSQPSLNPTAGGESSTHRPTSSSAMASAPRPLRRSSSPSSSHLPSVRPLTPPTSTAPTPSMPPPSSSRQSSPSTSSVRFPSEQVAPSSDRKMSVDRAQPLAQPSSPPDDDQTMRSPTIVLTDRRAKRASSGAHAALEGAEYGRDSNVLTSSSSSSSKQMRLSRAQKGDTPLSGADFEDHASHRRSTERAAVLQDVQSSRNERSLRRRPSLSSHSSREDQRSRTPSPILGDAYPYAGASTRPGHTGAPMIGPSAADLQALLYDKSERSSRSSTHRPPGLPDSTEIAAIIARVEDLGVKDEVGASDSAGTSSPASKEVELVQIVKKLGQHALEQETYLQSMEESLHNTRVTAVSVVSSLTAQHAYELSQEKQLRDRLEVELDGVQTSAKKLSSLLAKAQSRNEGKDRERAASVEEEMKWVASLPGGSAKKPSSAATAAANAAMSPRQPGGSGYSDPFIGEEARKTGELAGLGISETPLLPQSEYTDIFDSPMSAMISERNKLVADKRHLKNRVRDAEAQLHRLENELKALRPLLLQGSAKAFSTSSTMASVPATPSSSQRTPGRIRKDPGSARRRRHNVMGDAESEHLLLAARRLNHARAQAEASMPPFSETSPLKPTTARFAAVGEHPSTPPGRLNVPPRTPGTANTITARTPRSTGKSRVSLMDSVFANGGPALPGSPQSRSKPSFRSHERLNSATSGIDELLQAAQTVQTPRDQRVNSLVGNGSSEQLRALADSAEASDTYFPRMPQVGSKTTTAAPISAAPGLASAIALERPQTHDSPKRRRMSATAVDQDRLAFLSSSPQARYLNSLRTTDGGVVNGTGSRRLRTRTEGSTHPSSDSRREGRSGSGDREGDGGGISALDLLADQATASQNPSSSSEPSTSDGEKKTDSYSGRGENGRGKAAVDEDTRESYHVSSGPKQVASSLMAARARVAGGGAPIAYAHSPHSEYSERGTNAPLPRYSTGYPPPSPHGTSGSHHSQLSSPITSSHSGGPMLPPPPGGSDAFHLRRGDSTGHLPTAYGGHANLPHLNTSVNHHGHPHQQPYSHQYNQQMHGHMPMSPHSHSMPPHLNLQHSHHHPSTTANGSPLPPTLPMPNGYMSSASPSPISATTPHHGYGYHPQQQQQQQQQQPLHSPHSSSGHRPSLSLDSSKTPKPKGGNTSPDKRLPYVRWTSEEDAKLRQAIMQHGQRWEAVAKAVGTRSYHQCRQRALLMRRKGLDPVVAGAGGSGGGSGGGDRGGSGSSASGGRGGTAGDGGSATPDADGDEGDELVEGEGEGEDGEGEDGEEYANVEGSASHDSEQQQQQQYAGQRHQQHAQHQQVDPRLH